MNSIQKYIPKDLVVVRNGAWSGGMDIYGDIRQVLVKPPSEEVRYDFLIKDDSEMVIFKRSMMGSLATENLRIPLFPGEKTLLIENSNYNGVFGIKILYQE